ncbi:MAG TPA: hypothetical protein VGW12_18220 [Pyrinomonadaceae bacterium]|nr:hypothetical protein [Pyrinomonadaceae bacterium]
MKTRLWEFENMAGENESGGDESCLIKVASVKAASGERVEQARMGGV